MAAFQFELVSPEKMLFSGEVEAVVMASSEGEMTILKDHAPLMTSLRPGVVTVQETAAKASKLFVRGGFAEVSPRGLTILAEEALPLEQLDAARLEQQIKDAQEDAADAQDEEARRLAAEKIAQLNELRTALRL
jgi:F-type H+-transporting ATPase subunit epsilon